MKIITSFSMVMSILLFTLSCNPSKQIIISEDYKVPNTPTEIEKTPTRPINKSNEVELSLDYPSDKKTIETNLRIEKRQGLYPDKYGNIEDYRDIPLYDINNQPISVWFISDDSRYVGFIVAGHATKAVCEVASLEVYNKLKAIGKDDASIFSFGVGYNFKRNNDSDYTYHSTLEEMKIKFEDLSYEYPEQVNIGIIPVSQYNEYLSLLKSHINLANRSDEWTTHIVEYKLNNFPLIAPFYYSETSQIIQIRVPKSKFGGIPTELVYAAYEEALSEGEDELNENLRNNQIALNEIRNYSNPYNTDIEIISYWTVEGDYIINRQEELRGHRPPPDGYYLVEPDGARRPLTFKQAIPYLNDPNTIVYPTARRRLEHWIKQAEEDMKDFHRQRKSLREKINDGNKKIEKLIAKIDDRRAKLRNRDNQDYIIDAFLRGWVFEAGSDEMNRKLDNWYATYRQTVWNYMLDQVSTSNVNARVLGKLGGVFHSDDVFFQVNSEGNNFIITPYKVVGGEFIQVIDKEIGISYIQSPFNFRFEK